MQNRFFVAFMFIMLTGSTIVSAKNIKPDFEAIDLNQDNFITSEKFQSRNILPARLIAPDQNHLSELGPAEYSVAQVQGQEEEGTVPEQEMGGGQVLQGQEEEGTVPEQETGGGQVLQGQEQETGEGQVLQGYEENGEQNGTTR